MEMNDDDFRHNCQLIAEFVTEYKRKLNSNELPIIGKVEPGQVYNAFEQKVNDEGEKRLVNLLNEVKDKIVPGMCNWAHPDFLAWFPNTNSRISTLGLMLEHELSCVGFSWNASPALTELEQLTLDWLADCLGLPDHFKFSSQGPGGGCIQGQASYATFYACLAARSRVFALVDNATDPLKLVAYSSDQVRN